MDSHRYESVRALVLGLHAPNKNVSRPHSDEETSNDEDRSTSPNIHSLPILAVEKPNRKRSLFESPFKIPTLTISGPQSPESPENMAHRRFSFGNFRRHSHSSVRRFEILLCVIRVVVTSINKLMIPNDFQ